MSSVRRLIVVLALVLAAIPLQASATILNGMKVIWQVDTARSILDNAVIGCPSISNVTLRVECASYTDNLRGLIETWESEFSAGTLTVAFDASTEVSIYNDEAALKTIANESGFSYTGPEVVRAPLELEVDELVPQPDGFSAGCVACFGTVTTLTVTCAKVAPGWSKALCFVGGAVGVYVCGNSQACTSPPAPPQACVT